MPSCIRSKSNKGNIYQYFVTCLTLCWDILRSSHPCIPITQPWHWPWMRPAPKMNRQPRSLGGLRRWPKTPKTLLEHSEYNISAFLSISSATSEKKNLATGNSKSSYSISLYISIFSLYLLYNIFPWSLKVKRKDAETVFSVQLQLENFWNTSHSDLNNEIVAFGAALQIDGSSVPTISSVVVDNYRNLSGMYKLGSLAHSCPDLSTSLAGTHGVDSLMFWTLQYTYRCMMNIYEG